MNKISYSELEDMEYYNKDYRKEDWENKTAKEFMEYYIQNDIDLDVTTWVRLNECSDEMYYKGAFIDQLVFIRDNIGMMFFKDVECNSLEKMRDYSNLKQRNIKVDSTHCSKSIKMPVYRIYANGKDDLIITISDNFYGYQVSVESKIFNIDLDFSKLFDITKVPDWMYGFKEDRVFKNYSQSGMKFSFGIVNKYHLYMVMYQISELWKDKLL